MNACFVTGTDTGVGKTLVAAALIHAYRRKGLRAIGMKPVAAGAIRTDGGWDNEDVRALLAASDVNAPLDEVNPYCFEPPIAPHIAAAQAGVTIDLDHLARCFGALRRRADAVVVEGAGGFVVPLGTDTTFADLAMQLRIPVILVVGMRLGCLNHALLTQEAIAARGLRLAGWVANNIDAQMPCYAENLRTLTQRLPGPLLGEIPWTAAPDPARISLELPAAAD